MNDQQDQQTDPPAETQSAVEWLMRNTESIERPRELLIYLPLKDALELARRCEAAEQKAEQLELNAVAFVCGNPCDAHSGSNSPRIEEIVEMSKGCQVCRYREHRDLRAQLAAAQAGAGRLREALEHIAQYAGEHTDTEYGILHHNASWCAEQARSALNQTD